MKWFGRNKKKYRDNLRVFYKKIEEANYITVDYGKSKEYVDFRKHYKKYLKILMENMALDAYSPQEGLVIFDLLDAKKENEKASCIDKQYLKNLEVINHHVGVYKGAYLYGIQCRDLLLRDKEANKKETEQYEQIKENLWLKEK